jgi:hypothetical protein
MEKIKEERPALAQKIAMFRPEVTPILMKRVARAGYPPY